LGGLYLGYNQGVKVIDLLARLKVQRLAQRIRRVMALLVGVSTVVLIPAHEHVFSLGGLWSALALVTVGILLLRTVGRRARALYFWYPLILVAVACGFLVCLDIFSGG
jgi:hypothetical protein